MRLHLASRSLLCAVATTMLLNACTATRPATVGELHADDAISVRSGRHFAYVRTDGLYCEVYGVVGLVAEVRGDTVTMRRVRSVNAHGGTAAACAQPADGVFVVTKEGPILELTQKDQGRTSALIVGTVLVVALVVVLATSLGNGAVVPAY